MTRLRKLSRADHPNIARRLAAKQGGICPLCLEALDFSSAGRYSHWVLDHDHISGEVRGTLCRACNGAEGKVFNIVATWGKQGKGGYDNAVAWLERLLTYLKNPEPTGLMYADHKTEEERAAKAREKVRKARMQGAATKAARTQTSRVRRNDVKKGSTNE